MKIKVKTWSLSISRGICVKNSEALANRLPRKTENRVLDLQNLHWNILRPHSEDLESSMCRFLEKFQLELKKMEEAHENKKPWL
jgi:hypothetical protein